ncbi:MAG: amidohydrolase family protein [Planctomycetes bacterium]|nr:amidohydrolase family protein [Planctomycetota bacterium]
MRIDRRRFAHKTGRAALAAALFGGVGLIEGRAGEEQSLKEGGLMPIVDTHQHLWDLDVVKLGWLKSAGHLNRNHVTKDYLEATEGLNVVKTVYMEVAVDSDYLVTEAEYVVGLCKRDDNPTAAAVIGGRPGEEGFREYITRFKGSPYVKGVRHIMPGNAPDLWSEKQFVEGIQLLGELGMRFDLCMPPARLPDAAKLVDACPETRFVLDHCGNADPVAFMSAERREAARPARAPQHEADQWRRDLAKLAERERVVCKISGIIARAPKDNWTPDDLAPIINHCLDVFGPDRVIFASDWPVCTRAASLCQWVGALKEIVASRPEGERRKLFHDNAVRFYELA